MPAISTPAIIINHGNPPAYNDNLAAPFEDETPPFNIDTMTSDEKRELVEADAASVLSSTTTLGVSELLFTPAKTLRIEAKGVAALRLPTPHAELETTIHNYNGSFAYASMREKKSSGNCILSDANGNALIATEYFFGPSKDPVLRRLDVGGGAHEIKTVSKWTSRNHKFLLPDGRTLAWTYKKDTGFGTRGAKGTALVLTLGERRIAALVRNDDTRTPGSLVMSAGNGGELVLGEDVGGKDGINEDLVVATCLLMLKKEIDRRRTVQFMVIAGVIL
jgi:hypothetical protein